MSILLNSLPIEAFTFLLAFARIGAAVMLFPVFGEPSVSPRVRLIIALALTLLMLPTARAALPEVVPGTFAAFVLLIQEILYGLILGILVKILVSTLNVAGTAISMFSGLGFAQSFDPAQGSQSAFVATFLSLLSVTLMALTDIHYLLLDALNDSYRYFSPRNGIPVGDLSQLATSWVAGAFLMGLKLSLPFMVFSLLFYLGIGVLSKLMPQVQIFFIAMPMNILVGFTLLMFLLSTIVLAFLGYFESQIAVLRGV